MYKVICYLKEYGTYEIKAKTYIDGIIKGRELVYDDSTEVVGFEVVPEEDYDAER